MEVHFIQLTQGQTAIVDDEDGDLVSVKWHAKRGKRTWYAKRSVHNPDSQQCRTQFLHRVIASRMGLDPELEVDHQDRNGLNCTRLNLRQATSQQNKANQRIRADNVSGVKGVRWDRSRGKWRAEIYINRKNRFLGYFTDFELATSVSRTARKEAFGEFACND